MSFHMEYVLGGIEPGTKGTQKRTLKSTALQWHYYGPEINQLCTYPVVQWPARAQIWKRPPSVATSVPSFPPPPPLLPAAVHMSLPLATPPGCKVSMAPPFSPTLADDNPAARERHVTKDKHNDNDKEGWK